MARGKKKVQPRFWLIVITVTLAAFVYFYTAQETLMQSQQAIIRELSEKTEQMTVEIAEAERKLEFAKSDEYVIRVARSTLGLVMPDEVLYVPAN